MLDLTFDARVLVDEAYEEIMDVPSFRRVGDVHRFVDPRHCDALIYRLYDKDREVVDEREYKDKWRRYYELPLTVSPEPTPRNNYFVQATSSSSPTSSYQYAMDPQGMVYHQPTASGVADASFSLVDRLARVSLPLGELDGLTLNPHSNPDDHGGVMVLLLVYMGTEGLIDHQHQINREQYQHMMDASKYVMDPQKFAFRDFWTGA